MSNLEWKLTGTNYEAFCTNEKLQYLCSKFLLYGNELEFDCTLKEKTPINILWQALNFGKFSNVTRWR